MISLLFLHLILATAVDDVSVETANPMHQPTTPLERLEAALATAIPGLSATASGFVTLGEPAPIIIIDPTSARAGGSSETDSSESASESGGEDGSNAGGGDGASHAAPGADVGWSWWPWSRSYAALEPQDTAATGRRDVPLDTGVDTGPARWTTPCECLRLRAYRAGPLECRAYACVGLLGMMWAGLHVENQRLANAPRRYVPNSRYPTPATSSLPTFPPSPLYPTASPSRAPTEHWQLARDNQLHMADLVPSGTLGAIDYPQASDDYPASLDYYIQHPDHGIYNSGKHPNAFISGYKSCFNTAAEGQWFGTPQQQWCDSHSGDFSEQVLRWAHLLRFNGFANNVDKLLENNKSHLVDKKCIRIQQPAADCKASGPDDTTPCGLWTHCREFGEWSVFHMHNSGPHLLILPLGSDSATGALFEKACHLAYDLRHNEDGGNCASLKGRVKALEWRAYNHRHVDPVTSEIEFDDDFVDHD